ncbi:carbohydrate ABC transporter permease [Alicyclobacillus acidocaldarius]|uniref:Binding-protein-dependent transport systems inner membrane component n=1 Tax=Alicyclobacillus acidocaldarius subsp. acidocaldarius (strain ATCC 27009 / DSM 446 / BCRC 14685 / JCM 5260 / KCTC 1825 / NBRC 15652 / NCIMB 11725 / NRRL B-14509 / 104-IA) TaxID=521098 RepID=C8WQB5_ALIAD|nr:carbohydrate ABC transporter permease [Alicyclobacillus acidocaldarius]ACV59060.1 binding-protein-dependent transport systems inner membrane component [Alicyclobacillus acidocaldarius subsp. acidocaldarius DSM 446]
MRKLFIYAALIVVTLFVLGPFIWMLSTSLKPADEVLTATPMLWPHPVEWSNYAAAWRSAPFSRYFLNSLFISGVETAFDLTLGAMAAYAFARLEFAGKRPLFLALLATLMVPGELLLIPNYITVAKLHWMSTYQGIIVPWLVSVFTIFLMRQFFLSMPSEIFEAAELDGLHPVRTLFQIVMPLTKPVWITAGLIKFIGSWNSFLWVVVVSNSQSLDTVPVGLMNFTSDVGTEYNQLMAAATFCMVPLAIVFLIGQRYFIEGITRSGIR